MTMHEMLHHIVQQWYETFEFFEPRELATLLYTSCKTMQRVVRSMIRYFSWWLLLWTGLIDLFVDGEGVFGHMWEYWRPLYYSIGVDPRIHVVTVAIVVFFITLAARASIEAKNARYFIRYLPRIFGYGVLFFLLPHIYSIPLFWLAAFFFYDTKNTWRGLMHSLFNATMFVASYAPFVVVHGAAHGVVFHLYKLVWECLNIEEYHGFAYALKYAGSLVLYLFFVAMLATLYARVVHSNSRNPLFLRLRNY
jgi:hypothetical protein